VRLGLPKSLRVFGTSCFKNCEFLAEIVIEASSQLRMIEPAAFRTILLTVIRSPLANPADFVAAPQECPLTVENVPQLALRQPVCDTPSFRVLLHSDVVNDDVTAREDRINCFPRIPKRLIGIRRISQWFSECISRPAAQTSEQESQPHIRNGSGLIEGKISLLAYKFENICNDRPITKLNLSRSG
jgi:hypothetical protein